MRHVGDLHQPRAQPAGVAARPAAVGQGLPHQRGRQRRLPAGRDGRRAGLGQLPVGRLVRGALAHHRGLPPRDVGHRPRPARLGQRRRDGDLLRGGRPRDQPRGHHGRPAGQADRRGPRARRARRPAGPRADLPGVQRRDGRGARVGRRDVDGHRVPRRDPRPVRPQVPGPPAPVPAHARDRRRHRRDHRDVDLLHRRGRHGRARPGGGDRGRDPRAALAERLAARAVRGRGDRAVVRRAGLRRARDARRGDRRPAGAGPARGAGDHRGGRGATAAS